MHGHKHGRIAMLEREQVTPEIGALYDQLLAQRGVVPNMFKTVARTPQLALGIAAFLKPLLKDGALPGWYKELVATRVAILQGCDY
jgi:alkylhydroperoxidase family enzyme